MFKQKLNFAERRKQENSMEKNKLKHGGGDEGHSIGHYEVSYCACCAVRMS